jgi:hypothetical protein
VIKPELTDRYTWCTNIINQYNERWIRNSVINKCLSSVSLSSIFHLLSFIQYVKNQKPGRYNGRSNSDSYSNSFNGWNGGVNVTLRTFSQNRNAETWPIMPISAMIITVMLWNSRGRQCYSSFSKGVVLRCACLNPHISSRCRRIRLNTVRTGISYPPLRDGGRINLNQREHESNSYKMIIFNSLRANWSWI